MQHPLARDWAVIQLLQQGQPYPCHQIANLLGITPANLVEHFHYLQDLGVDVVVTQQGICFATPVDLLDGALIPTPANLLALDTGIEIVPVVDSTNAALLQKAKQGIKQAILLAEYQTQGRGQRGRRWLGQLGQLLMMSILQRFDAQFTRINGLSLVVGLAVVETLTQMGWQGLQLKWPNDILFSRQKLGGILIETIVQQQEIAAVIGLGLNVHSAPHASDQPVTCLAQVAHQDKAMVLNRSLIAANILQQLSHYLAQFAAQGLTPFLPLWRQYDGLAGHTIKILHQEQSKIGVAQGIDNAGALLVNIEGKLVALTAAEVQQVRQADITMP